MNWQITTQPQTEPISLAEAKLHLRVDHDDEDSLIESLIRAARKWCEDYQNRLYITQTVTAKIDSFPKCYIMELPRPPLQSVDSITYTDTTGQEQALTDYIVDTSAEPARITPLYSEVWPNTQAVINAVTVEYVAGYGDAEDVPDVIKQAILLLAGHLYCNREQVSQLRLQEVPFGVVSLLSMNRVF